MMKKILFMALALFATSAALANTGDEVWKSVTNWGEYCPHDEMGTITAYALYDVDQDGISECFVQGDYDSFGFLTCSDGQGNVSKANIRLVVNSLNTTSLDILEAQGKFFILHQGGCGSGCALSEFYKITHSTWALAYQEVMYCPPSEDEGGIESECTLLKPDQEPRKISPEMFERSTPQQPSCMQMEELEWVKVK